MKIIHRMIQAKGPDGKIKIFCEGREVSPMFDRFFSNGYNV